MKSLNYYFSKPRVLCLFILWVIFISAVVLFHLKNSSLKRLPASVENPLYRISSPDTVRVKSVFVSLGDLVKKGDPLIQLDTSDIDENIAGLEAAIQTEILDLELEKLSVNRQFLNAINKQRQELDEVNLEYEQNQVERHILDEEMKRVAVLLEQNLIDSNSLLKVKSRKAIVEKAIELAPDKIKVLEQNIINLYEQKTRSEKKLNAFFLKDDGIDNAVLSPRYKELELLKKKRDSYTLRANFAAVIYEVNAHVASVVKASDPIITLSLPKVNQAVAYLPEENSRLFYKGLKLMVYSKSPEISSVGILAKVRSVSPTIEPISTNTIMNSIPLFGRKIQIDFIGNHDFLPGENLMLEILPRSENVEKDKALTVKKVSFNFQI